jgi:hypothetical protein
MTTLMTTLVLLLALLAGSVRPAVAADAVLLTATAPGYTPGMAVAVTDTLALPEGASMTLLFRSGQILRLRGPFEGSLERIQATADKATVPALAQLFRLQGVDAAVIGGTRTTNTAEVHATGDLQVDPQRSATYCLGPSDVVWIGWPGTEGESYGVRRRSNTRAIVWPAGATRTAWPDDVPIEDGDRFEIVAGNTPRATLTFRVLPPNFPSDAAWVAAGILAGCHEQFDAPLRRLARAAVPPELWLTSDRGRAPVYRSGEPIRFTAQSDTDGWLYCVAVRSDQSAVPIFPAGAVDGARLRAAVPVSIPGGRRSGDIRTGPKGAERIACWLADRDISPELPHALLDAAAGHLPDRLAADLDAVFGSVSGAGIVRAELAITVE